MVARRIMELMSNVSQAATPVPSAFLGPIFEPGVEPVIATGFNYDAAEVAVHGVATHNAIDFDLPRGTKILAPADGQYVATYGEALLHDKDGKPLRLSHRQALARNPRNRDIHPPDEDGEWPLYFGSYVIQGWHGRGRYTQYAHVDWVSPDIPFYPPEEITDEEGHKTGDLRHSAILRAPVSEYRRPGVAAFVRAGEVIGEVGMTGCGWGRRCYDFAKFDAHTRPDFRKANYTYYTEPHLHFAVLGRRAPRTRKAKALDPFGIYGQADKGYPTSLSQWPRQRHQAKHHPLWLHQGG
jgi:murein DD-endopeptidase MepM/ murein hydrolase activator NlpD